FPPVVGKVRRLRFFFPALLPDGHFSFFTDQHGILFFHRLNLHLPELLRISKKLFLRFFFLKISVKCLLFRKRLKLEKKLSLLLQRSHFYSYYTLFAPWITYHRTD